MNWWNWVVPIAIANTILGVVQMVRIWRDASLLTQQMGQIKEGLQIEKVRNDAQDVRLAQQDNLLGRIDEKLDSIKETLERLDRRP